MNRYTSPHDMPDWDYPYTRPEPDPDFDAEVEFENGADECAERFDVQPTGATAELFAQLKVVDDDTIARWKHDLAESER